MKKVNIPELPWVVMKDGSFSDCFIWLVHEWTVNEHNMGLIILRDKKDKNAAPKALEVRLEKLNFVQYRGHI